MNERSFRGQNLKTIGLIAVITGWLTLTFWGVKIGVLESESIVLRVGLSVFWLGFLVLLVVALLARSKNTKDDSRKDAEA